MTNITPTPWIASGNQVQDLQGRVICEIVNGHNVKDLAYASGNVLTAKDDGGEANAELIARAVTSHDALVGALKEVVAHSKSAWCGNTAVIDRAEKALAAAQVIMTLQQRIALYDAQIAWITAHLAAADALIEVEAHEGSTDYVREEWATLKYKSSVFRRENMLPFLAWETILETLAERRQAIVDALTPMKVAA